MKKQSDNELWICCLIPSIASLAWEAFEENGLTIWCSHDQWEEALNNAIGKITKLINSIHPFVRSDGGKTTNDEEGATWLNPELK